MTLVIRDLALKNQFDQEDYFYDEFVGKWAKKRKVKRASNPRRITRKENRLRKRIPKTVKRVKANKINKTDKTDKRVRRIRGMKKSRPIVRRTPTKQVRVLAKKKLVPIKTSSIPAPVIQTTMIPLTRREAQVHKNANKAIQEEHKTKQEELKTKTLENQIVQEAAKTEQIKGQTKMANTSKGLLWVVGILGAVLVVKYVFVDATPSAKPLSGSPIV